MKKAKLATPIQSDDGAVTEAASEIDWTSTSGAIKPGEFDEFPLSVGPLPKADQMVFKAIQHYSDGKDVAWIEQAADGAAEPAHPAPTLNLAAAAARGATAATPSASAVTVTANAPAAKSDDASKGMSARHWLSAASVSCSALADWTWVCRHPAGAGARSPRRRPPTVPPSPSDRSEYQCHLPA